MTCRCAAPAILAPAILAFLVPACGGGLPGSDAADLIDQTTAGEQRCVTEGDEAKLFVVDWDATDASTFQARAARDVVFVRYEACGLRILDGCSDGSLAGRYGTYREPVFTSGAVESFVVKTQDELAAKLPLGVVTLGGELSNDRALELSYHVSGTAVATRDEVYRDELAQNPRCAEATHVVVAYNLGAFRLGTKEQTTAGAGAEVQGFGAEGKHHQEREALRKAGDMAACNRVDNHPCRVPIRLTLRPIRAGAAPTAGAPPALPIPVAAGLPPAASGTMTAIGIEAQAQQKYMAHDGAGCLADLEQADASDPQGRMRRLELRARCAMRAGKCEEGKNHYREARRAWYRDHNPTGLASDATVEYEVTQLAAAECATKAGGGKSVQNSALGLLQQIMLASVAGDADACVSQGQALHALVKKGGGDPRADHMAWAGLQKAAQCAAAGGRCQEAKPLYLESVRGMDPGISDDFAESAWEQNVPACKGK